MLRVRLRRHRVRPRHAGHARRPDRRGSEWQRGDLDGERGDLHRERVDGDRARDRAAETSTTEGGGEDFTAAKATFVSTCGGCHTLSDAGTSGAVGPDLSTIGLNSSDIEKQIENGGGAMPAGLLQGDEAKAVSDYVASVDGS